MTFLIWYLILGIIFQVFVVLLERNIRRKRRAPLRRSLSPWIVILWPLLLLSVLVNGG